MNPTPQRLRAIPPGLAALRGTTNLESPRRWPGPQALASLLLVTLLATTAVVAWRWKAPPRKQLRIVLVLDVSGSNDGTLAADLRRMAASWLARGQDSLIVLVMATGDETTVYQPRLLGTAAWESTGKVLELQGRDVAAERFLDEMAAFARMVEPTQSSPILDALVAASDDAESADCDDEGVTCELIVRTDGIETHDTRVKNALRGRRTRHAADADDSARIRVSQYDAVVMCGLAQREHVPGGFNASVSMAAIEQGWRPEFDPSDIVDFEPHCDPMTVAAIASETDAQEIAPSASVAAPRQPTTPWSR